MSSITPSRYQGVPDLRIRAANERPITKERDYVLYWMTSARRPRWNFALERAVEHADSLGKPLLVLEGLRCDYRWASDRHHRFVIRGMRENRRAFEDAGVRYLPYVEPRKGDGKGLLEALARRACLVVGDDYPAFFLPRMLDAAAEKLDVRLELVDGNGLLPMRQPQREFTRAFSLRIHLQKHLPPHLWHFPALNPLARKDLSGAVVARDVLDRWSLASAELLDGEGAAGLEELPIDHDVAPVESLPGGWQAGDTRVKSFVDDRLAAYGEERNEPEKDASSGLSPWLHFGHVSVHQVLERITARTKWSLDDVSDEPRGGAREDWWGADASTEAFLDELVTWRELGFNCCHERADYDRYESLPDFALTTLAEHAADPREHVYTLEEFETARTHDPLWNSAQMQLVREGRIHNYLRMLWGKKIFEWSNSPREALDVMIELNNKYALDGRDPNSYSGIFWVLGRYDRAWGPERPVFGKIRYMTSANTARKVRVKGYIEKWAPEDAQGSLFG